MKLELSLPKTVLPYIQGKVDNFYLAGGTALTMFYYEHRESDDLDFFTQDYSKGRVVKVIENLQKDSGWPVKPLSEQNKEGLIKLAMYLVKISDEQTCKIDFVEDYIELMNPLKRMDDINILSLEDIYLRKIYTIAGHIPSVNEIGQNVVWGGRREAKDFLDIYCLSTITMPLSQFVSRYCKPVIKEAIVRWYRTYDRMAIKTGLLELITKTKPDFRKMDSHFKEEVDKLLKTMIEGE